MEGRLGSSSSSSRVRAVVGMVILVAGMVLAQSNNTAASSSSSSFNDCYAKCFLFCMIEPTQTLCSCTTQCLRECIFPKAAASPKATITNTDAADSLAFCKLGCASSFCSNISTKLNPNGQNMGSCVGSCSDKCIVGYS